MILLMKARSIIFAGLDWTSVKVQNGVAMYIVENGYHYPTRLISGTSVPLFNSLADGYVDVSMEVWLPNQKVAWDNAIKRGQVVNVGKSLTDSWQSTFVVHKHTIDRNPGLRKATDLKQYYHLFHLRKRYRNFSNFQFFLSMVQRELIAHYQSSFFF